LFFLFGGVVEEDEQKKRKINEKSKNVTQKKGVKHKTKFAGKRGGFLVVDSLAWMRN
jgi:hypothetical protein